MTDQFTINKLIYKDLSADHLKKIKQLLRSTTGERIITAQKTDPIYLVFDKKKKIVGYTMISNYSPENHFKIEGPYVYNFITDTNLSKEKRCGRFLLNYIVEDLSSEGASIINLDVEHSNLHAFKFFIRGGFRVVGKYEKLDLRNMNLYEIDKSIRQFNLQDKIDEIKQRRGFNNSESETVTIMDDNETPNKKIVFISLSKSLNAHN